MSDFNPNWLEDMTRTSQDSGLGIDGQELLRELVELHSAMEPIPKPQFAIVHPDDFDAFKAGLEREGLTVTPVDPSPSIKPNLWNATVGTLRALVLRIAIADHVEPGKALIMPMSMPAMRRETRYC